MCIHISIHKTYWHEYDIYIVFMNIGSTCAHAQLSTHMYMWSLYSQCLVVHTHFYTHVNIGSTCAYAQLCIHITIDTHTFLYTYTYWHTDDICIYRGCRLYVRVCHTHIEMCIYDIYIVNIGSTCTHTQPGSEHIRLEMQHEIQIGLRKLSC